MKHRNAEDDKTLTNIKIAASLTDAPFKTAFKATMGVAVAQLAITAIFIVGFIGVSTLVYFLVK